MPDDKNLEQEIEAASAKLKSARANIKKIIFGQDALIDECLTAILSGGHFLLIGLPGLGKTKLVETLGQVLGLQNNRIQYTPDLMPADILGSEILMGDNEHRRFDFIKGPIFCQLLMADEINRASPRTQSALLQAMQEYKVSISGKTYDLPKPFHVMATQNPLEQEGTYPLPEAQLDRFIMQIDITYPEFENEMQMLRATTFSTAEKAETALQSDDLIAMQNLVRLMPVGEKVAEGILKLVQSTRPSQSKSEFVQKYVSWGASPRASQALMLTARAKALLEDRLSPSMDDIVALAPAILKHRMGLNFNARVDGIKIEDVIAKLCAEI